MMGVKLRTGSNILVWMLAFVVLAATQSDDELTVGDSSQQPNQREKRPIDTAMDPLYTMTNTFLGIIQPQQKGLIFEKTDTVDGMYTFII